MNIAQVEQAEAGARDNLRIAGYFYAHPKSSGEVAAARYVAGKGNIRTIIDGGSHDGEWMSTAGLAFDEEGGEVEFHCFEPMKSSFEKLKGIVMPRTILNNCALSKEDGDAILYAHVEGSACASLVGRDLSHFNENASLIQERVKTRNLKSYCDEKGIKRIDFLKLDVEGWEFHVLESIIDWIRTGAVRFIQIEYGFTNVDTRTYLRDFYKLLRPQYNFFRIMPEGLYPCNEWKECYENFCLSNYLLELV